MHPKIQQITIFEEGEFIGRRFGDLTVIQKTSERQDGHVMWLCGCACGRFVKVRATRLTNDLKRSCGKCGKCSY